MYFRNIYLILIHVYYYSVHSYLYMYLKQLHDTVLQISLRESLIIIVVIVSCVRLTKTTFKLISDITSSKIDVKQIYDQGPRQYKCHYCLRHVTNNENPPNLNVLIDKFMVICKFSFVKTNFYTDCSASSHDIKLL